MALLPVNEVICVVRNIDFDEFFAGGCAELCSISYQPESALSVNTIPDAVLKSHVTGKMDSFGYLVIRDKTLYVVFRGTCTLQNIATDLAAVLAPLPYPNDTAGIAVHYGMGASYFAMRLKLLEDIKLSLQHHPEVTRVTFTVRFNG